jgi:hypothetical protein
MFDDRKGDMVIPAPLERIGIGIVADDDFDLCIQFSGFNMIDQGLEIRTASRNKDPNVDFFMHR